MKKLSLTFLCIVLGSCSTLSQVPAVVPTHLSAFTATLHVTAVPPTPTFTQTIEPPTATFTVLPSWTPLPTLEDQNSFLDFISFTESNTCKFPCWASIVPGQTNWDEAVFALRPLETVANLEVLNNQESSYGIVNTVSWYLYGGDFRTDGKFLTGNNVNLIRLHYESFSEGVPSYSTPLPARFNLQRVLTEYGIPSMVFIYTFIHDEQGPLPFSLLLVYPENHFYVIYQRDAKLSGNTVVACDSDFYLELAVLDRKDKLASADAIADTPETKSIGIENWKPVEQVLGISPEEFHKIYTTSATGCITFSSSLWKP